METDSGISEFHARSYAIKLLARKPLSEKELTAKLTENFSEDDAAAAVAYLKESNYINDRELAEMLTERLLYKKKGESAILFQLKSRGIDRDVAIDVVAEIDDEVIEANINELLDGYDLLDIADRRRALGALIRRGYNKDNILKAMKNQNDD
ncbi:MAG: recombination regulator RecX [Oscillospiraceae bacterium]|nr:recombination regulator RecX [Oscillospiraceae bacterium]